MNRRLLLPLAFLASLGLFAVPSASEAQCPPDAQFCGEVNVGPASARAVVRRPAVARGPVVVAQGPVVHHPQPVPRRVVVHRTPARVIVRHPPPRVIVVQTPAPAPRVVHHPAPAVHHPAPPPLAQRPPRVRRVGLFASGGGILADHVSMGGFAAGLKIRPVRHFGIRIGVGAYGGQDYYGDSRTEIPFTNDFLVYFNPDRMFQVYFLAGFHISGAVANSSITTTSPLGTIRHEEIERRYSHIGGQAGLGAELRLGRAFALTFDARVFLREQVRDGVTEFVEVQPDGSLRTTNTSAGALINFGGVVYF
jgi:hypothetical protein